MKESIKCILFPAFITLFVSCNLTSREPVEITKSRDIVSQYKALFVEPAKGVPSFHEVDGPITGNGDIGLTVSGLPEKQRYWISKSDFWKSGPDLKQAGPSLIGGIDIEIVDLKDASYKVEQILYEPVITSGFSTGENTVNINARVMATDNMIVLEIGTTRKPVNVQLNLWVKDGYGSITESGTENDITWVTRKFNGENLHYPAEASIATRTPGMQKNSFIVEPGKTVKIVASVVTNNETDVYRKIATEKVAKADLQLLNKLLSDHNKWWQEFWAKSFVEIEDKLLEKYYYASHYIMACCSRNINFPPGLYGNWTTMDRLAWSGDIHLNYNHEAPYWALYSSNRVGLTDPYDAPLLEHIEIFREDARKYLNKNGAYAGVAIGPKGLTIKTFDIAGLEKAYSKLGSKNLESIAGQPSFLGQKSNAIFAAMNMILRYHYTYDEKYLRKIYPFMLSVADFWEDYLKFENGRYVDYDDSFQEVGPWQGKDWDKGYGDFNPINTLGFLRTFFDAMTEMSTELKADSARQVKWKHIMANLSALPTVDHKGRKRFRACEGGTGSAKNIIGLDWIMMHGLVFPATNIGLGSDTEQLKMILDDLNEWNDSIWVHHGNAFQTIFIGAARVGYNPDSLMIKARRKIQQYAYPNLHISAGGGGVETCSGIPGMINEMMLQSHGGIIRVFPVFPSNQKASFYRLRTFGAFLFSSKIENGNVRLIIIESEKGKNCTIDNPWPDRKITLYREGKIAETLAGNNVTFATKAGELITIVPEGVKNIEMQEFLKNHM
jgi:alpha-L-fucosidase 2